MEDVGQALWHEPEVPGFSPDEQEEGGVENLSLGDLFRGVGQAATARGLRFSNGVHNRGTSTLNKVPFKRTLWLFTGSNESHKLLLTVFGKQRYLYRGKRRAANENAYVKFFFRPRNLHHCL